MKWLVRAVVVLALIIFLAASYGIFTALRSENPVGFQVTRTSQGRTLPIAVWYPTKATPRPTTLLGSVVISVAPDAAIAGQNLPLIAISHGNGGGPGSHADLALALASAGYVVAAPLHEGDNYTDESGLSSAALFNRRVEELRAAVDHMLGAWQNRDRVDAQHVGAFGFSAGGFTVLAAEGAQPDLRLIAKHCAEASEFVCDLLRQVQSPLLRADAAAALNSFVPDPRIKAAVVAAPGLGFTLNPDALARLELPVQLWSAGNDVNAPYATNSKPVREALGSRAEFHEVPGAGHFSFLTPCGILAPPRLCSDQGSFNRKSFHAQMNASVVAFFNKELKGSK
jgi:predicted dienelactone hydrolase